MQTVKVYLGICLICLMLPVCVGGGDWGGGGGGGKGPVHMSQETLRVHPPTCGLCIILIKSWNNISNGRHWPHYCLQSPTL